VVPMAYKRYATQVKAHLKLMSCNGVYNNVLNL